MSETTRADLERRLTTSAVRRRFYDAVGDARSAQIERSVTDRLLDEGNHKGVWGHRRSSAGD